MKSSIFCQVSVIIPCYNAELFISETINSVLAQTYPNIEIVVVDDGSTDCSWQVIQTFGKRVHAIRQENSGGSCARNAGTRMARGKNLMFLDADDILAPDAVEHLVRALNGGADIAACPWRRLENVGDDWIKVQSGQAENPPEGDFLLGWLSGWYVPTCSLLWTRGTYEKTGGWDESLCANQDGDLILRALLAGAKICYTDKGESYYRSHGPGRVSVSQNRGILAFRSRMRVYEKVVDMLTALGCLERYRVPIGQRFHLLARINFETDVALAQECLKRSTEFAGDKAVLGSWSYRTLWRLMMLKNEFFVRSLYRFIVAIEGRNKNRCIAKAIGRARKSCR